MRSLAFATVLLIAIAGSPGGASAIPAPMPESELLSRSDLIGLIRVLSVTCTKVTKDASTGESCPALARRPN